MLKRQLYSHVQCSIIHSLDKIRKQSKCLVNVCMVKKCLIYVCVCVCVCVCVYSYNRILFSLTKKETIPFALT